MSSIAPDDLAHCRDAIRTGSRSFYAASRLLPAHVRDPALALYAFCRLADDAVDLTEDKAGAVVSLGTRMDMAYAGTPRDAAADRAFAAMVRDTDMPRALPDALLEGFAWDAEERRYDTLSELHGYSARVAAAVGAMMCVLMGVRGRDALSRACDLGLAMQLTNIARDVGEDARAGRIYLPLDWFAQAGTDPDAFLRNPQPLPEVREMTARLLREADRLYARATTGVRELPASARPGILAARHIYAAIGARLRAQGHDSVTQRATTGTARKLGLLSLAIAQSMAIGLWPRSAVLHAPPMPETRFLVEAAAQGAPQVPRAAAVLDILAQLEHRDRSARSPAQ